MPNARATQTLPRDIDRDELKQSLRHPHPESLEMAEVGFATWAKGLSDDASDLIAPDTGEEVPPEFEAELLESILESIAEADRGETISADELIERLRRPM